MLAPPGRSSSPSSSRRAAASQLRPWLWSAPRQGPAPSCQRPPALLAAHCAPSRALAPSPSPALPSSLRGSAGVWASGLRALVAPPTGPPQRQRPLQLCGSARNKEEQWRFCQGQGGAVAGNVLPFVSPGASELSGSATAPSVRTPGSQAATSRPGSGLAALSSRPFAPTSVFNRFALLVTTRIRRGGRPLVRSL